MKKISLLTAALLTSTIVAASAEMAAPVVPAAPCPPTPCPCPKAFQGFYLGGNFGYGIAAVTNNASGTDGESFKNKIAAQGFDGGLLIGYNYVFNNKFGLGLDVYFDWASTEGNASTNEDGGDNPVYKSVGFKNDIQVRVPFSYVICNLVAPKVYVGWANAGWSASYNDNNGEHSATNTSRYNGFLWGAGVDFLLAKHVVSGLEYTGIISQSKTFSTTDGVVSDTIRPMYNTVKATIKFIY